MRKQKPRAVYFLYRQTRGIVQNNVASVCAGAAYERKTKHCWAYCLTSLDSSATAELSAITEALRSLTTLSARDAVIPSYPKCTIQQVNRRKCQKAQRFPPQFLNSYIRCSIDILTYQTPEQLSQLFCLLFLARNSYWYLISCSVGRRSHCSFSFLFFYFTFYSKFDSFLFPSQPLTPSRE